MQITCPRCSSVVAAAELNMPQMVGKCTRCQQLFSFREQVENQQSHRALHADAIDAPQPANLTMSRDGLGLVLQWRWFRYYVLFLIPFALFWNAIVFSFVLPTVIMPFAQTNGEAFSLTSIFRFVPIFILPHTLVGLWLIYYILTLLLNQTTIHVRQGDIVVRHFPLPWLGNKTVAAQSIVQLYAKASSRWNRNNETTYEVHYIDRANHHAKLVGGLATSEHALFIEQEIERFLGIVDRPVRGEYR